MSEFTFKKEDVERFAELVHHYSLYNEVPINDRSILAVMNDEKHKPEMLSIAGTGMGILAFGRAIRSHLSN